ncbi:hypothetical protein BZK31_14200 [Pseudomonas floridensis]|uniref:DUF1652 domain-containing protein n=1 Tax=Pseudomonas floridensis TaxID=1958950 RepID=A0A1X0N5D0_9PSED|nr:DUF1652 domain-containing protein [Pseudomonas floridensis]ORC58646.1 hypothetical protein BZK31_14200 [Pseudomonas floridensis]
MYSKPDLQRTLETAFLPSRCECVITGSESLSIKLFHPESGDMQLYVTGMPLADLDTSRSIARLVLSLKEQRDLMGQMELSMKRLA